MVIATASHELLVQCFILRFLVPGIGLTIVGIPFVIFRFLLPGIGLTIITTFVTFTWKSMAARGCLTLTTSGKPILYYAPNFSALMH
jgi:hypothetical protein